jgi:hypothetical protein
LLEASPARRWIVGHALRGLVKQGHPRALQLLGIGEKPAVKVTSKDIPTAVKIGQKATFSCALMGTSEAPQTLQVDYRVYFVKANGSAQPKVFKLKRVELAVRQRLVLSATISFQVHTTRKPYQGKHLLELLINGQPFPLGHITVTE